MAASHPRDPAVSRGMSHAATDMNLWMVHADDRAPVLPDGLADQTARGQGVPDEAPQPSCLRDEGGDPNDLGARRWG